MSKTPTRAVVAAASALALWGWIELERSTESTWSGDGLYALAYLLLGIALCAVGVARLPDGLRDSARTLRTGTDRYAKTRGRGAATQLRALGWPRLRSVWLPVLLIPLQLVSLPVAFHTNPGDWSILGVLAVFALVVAPLCVLLGILAWTFAVLPAIWLVRFAVPAIRSARDLDARFALALAVTLFGFAALIVGAVAAQVRHRESRADIVLALFGAREVEHPVWVWIARAGILTVIAGLVLVRRVVTASARFASDVPG